jgi:hypothetical protein
MGCIGSVLDINQRTYYYILLIIIISIINLKLVINYSNPLVKLLLISAANI